MAIDKAGPIPPGEAELEVMNVVSPRECRGLDAIDAARSWWLQNRSRNRSGTHRCPVRCSLQSPTSSWA